MARNITEVHLLNVPLENDYKHTLYFSSISAQTSYFKSRKKFDEPANFSYQRKDKIIRYSKDYDDVVGCNYVMYKNSAYSSKWYYAFITKMEYINDGLTAIHIETDVLQTWMFDYTVKKSFVEREHCNDDTIGLHTVPEQLETGDYVINSKNVNNTLDNWTVVCASTVNINSDNFSDVAGKFYNGIYSGVRYYVLGIDVDKINELLVKLAEAGKSDAIQSIFMVPNMMISSTAPESGNFSTVDKSMEEERNDWIMGNLDETQNKKPTKIDGYEPKNNKLFTYPYCFINMSNNAGSSAIYKYELFNNPDDADLCDFWIIGAITPGMSIRLIPRYYNGVNENVDEGLTLGKYPICSWNTDVYTNWLTQNAVNIGVSTLNSAFQLAGGVAMLGTGAGALAGAGGITSGALGIASTIGEVYAHSLQPPQAQGNLNSGDVSFSAGHTTFTAYHMSIKKEYAKIIDHYFSMFGYKCHLNKTPNKNHRENYWYTKTIDVNIDGAIPSEDMQKIKNCYDNGITFWKNPSNIQDYSVSNEII